MMKPSARVNVALSGFDAIRFEMFVRCMCACDIPFRWILSVRFARGSGGRGHYMRRIAEFKRARDRRTCKYSKHLLAAA